MMRWWVAFLLMLNLLTLAWQWEAFAPWGWGPHSAREPERVQQQLRPDALQITNPAAAAQDTATPATSEASALASPAPLASTPATPTSP